MVIGIIAHIAIKMEVEDHCQLSTVHCQLTWDGTARLPAEPDGTPHKGLAGAIAGTIGNTMFIAGGANFPHGMPWEGGAKDYASDAFLYQIGEKGTLEFLRQGKLQEPLAYSGNCSAGGRVYVAGGENSRGATSSVRGFSLARDSIIAEALPDLPVPLTNGALAYASGKLYFVGGENARAVSDRIYALDLAKADAGWEDLCTLPYPVSHAVAVSDQKGTIYIAGGRARNPDGISTIYGQLLAVDLRAKTVAPIADLPRPSAAGTGVLAPEGNILLFGGDHGRTFHQVETLIAQINRATDPSEKNALTAEKTRIQCEHPGFSAECWAFSPAKKQWKRLGDLPAPSPVTTTALLHGNAVIIPSGEIRPGQRTDRILIGKMNAE